MDGAERISRKPGWLGQLFALVVVLAVGVLLALTVPLPAPHCSKGCGDNPLVAKARALRSKVWGVRLITHEERAVYSFRTISWAQAEFRERDSEADERLDYGTLVELNQHLGLRVETRQGSYRIRSGPGREEPEFTWWALAEPPPGYGRGHSFYADQRGQIYFTHSRGPHRGGLRENPAEEGWLKFEGWFLD